MAIWILLGVVAVLAFWFFSSYNKFVQIKAHIEASVQEIGNQLKRQADLIPNLVSSVKGYMKHEQNALKMITEARKKVLEVTGNTTPDVAQMLKLGDQLSKAFGTIQAVFESTPELKADGPTQKLMDELRDTSDKIMYARRTFIDLTADYNVMVASIPSNFVANMFGFVKLTGLEMPNTKAATSVKVEEMETPKVEL